MRLEDRVRRIEAYVFDRYVSGRTVPSIDESQSARFLDDYYSQTGRGEDANCCYAGILWFEVSFQPQERSRECLERARFWLQRAQQLSDDPWEPIEERLTDIQTMLAEPEAT